MTCLDSEAATGGVLEKKVFLKISEKSQENTCLFSNKAAGLKKLTLGTVFSCEFSKLRTPLLQNISDCLCWLKSSNFN